MSCGSLLPFISVVPHAVQVYADFNATDITAHDELSQAFLLHICIYLIVEVRLRPQFRCSGSIQTAAFCGVMRELQVKL